MNCSLQSHKLALLEMTFEDDPKENTVYNLIRLRNVIRSMNIKMTC